MADTATTALTSAGVLDGTEVLYCVDGANSRKTTAQAVADLVTPTSLSLVIGTDVQAYDANLPTWPAGVDATEVGYLNGVTSAIQTQIDGKQASNGNLDDIAALTDPAADAILFWDDSAGAYTHLTIGSGLSITGTEITATGGGGTPGGSSGQIQYNNASSFDGSLLWQGTNVIEQRNSTTAQNFRVYNTFTDASNYERLRVGWATNVMVISGEAAGTGSTTRNLQIYPNSLANAGIEFVNNATASGVNYYTRTAHQFYEDSDLKVIIGKNNIYPSHTGGNIALGLNSAGGGWKGIVSQELAADPSDPAEGMSVIWQSDGTGAGDDGDIMIKITAGGVTKTATLVDFSAVA